MKKKIDVILVNGNKIQSSYIESLLDPNKFNVKKFYEQDPACEYLQSNDDLTKVVIISYVLNQGNGFDLIKKLKKLDKDYPFIFLSSDNTIERVVEAMQTGAMDFLSKTYGLVENLVPVIERAFNTQIKILERKEIEEKLAQKNRELAKLSVVASETSNAVLIYNAKLELEWVNKAFVEFYGYSLEEFVDKKGLTLPQQSDFEDINRILQDCIMKKKSIIYTYATETKYGERIWLQSNISPVLNDNGIIEKFVLIETDITEIKKAERKIIIQQNKIRDSLNYAERIQCSIFPDLNVIKKYFDNFFILHLPREKVSGDFPFFYDKKNIVYIAAVDCTGHGVPGAFLSFVAYSNLVNLIDSGFDDTSEILSIMNQRVTKLLNKNIPCKKSLDGMEVALCKIDFNNNTIQYSGAGRPLFFIKNNELKIYKGDIMPIGGYQFNRKIVFSKEELNFETGYRFYIFSDGIQDQFKNGDSRQKYSSKRLKEYLKSTANLKMEDVYKVMLNDIKEWKGQAPQTDDILLMGFEFK